MDIQDWIDTITTIAEDTGEFEGVYDEPFDESESYPAFVIDTDIQDNPVSNSNLKYDRITEVYILDKVIDNSKKADRATARNSVDALSKAILDQFKDQLYGKNFRVLQKRFPKFQIGTKTIQSVYIKFSIRVFED